METRVWSLDGKISWSRKWQPTPVFLPGEFHGQRSLVGSWATGHGVTRVKHDLETQQQSYWAARPSLTTYKLKSYKAHFILAPSACSGGNNSSTRGFPIGPVVKTPCSQCRVQSLVRELRSLMPRGMDKKKKKKSSCPSQVVLRTKEVNIKDHSKESWHWQVLAINIILYPLN